MASRTVAVLTALLVASCGGSTAPRDPEAPPGSAAQHDPPPPAALQPADPGQVAVQCDGCEDDCQTDVDACVEDLEAGYNGCMTTCEGIGPVDVRDECHQECMADNDDAVVACETALVACEDRCGDACSP